VQLLLIIKSKLSEKIVSNQQLSAIKIISNQQSTSAEKFVLWSMDGKV
jgi:hypothetical protein